VVAKMEKEFDETKALQEYQSHFEDADLSRI